jgi:replication-associated recombination protein RarA
MKNEENKSTDPVDENNRLENTKRRTLLKALGYGAVALVGATGVYPTLGVAADFTKMPSSAVKLNPAVMELKQLDASKLRQLTLTKRMSPSTPITRMGLDPQGVAQLTPAAKGLTKADLEALGKGQTSGKLGQLSVEDVKSIQAAFGSHYNPGLAAIDVSCCCCTPCCCAAAVTEPLTQAA